MDPDKGLLRNLEISPSMPWRITGNKENLHEFTGHGRRSEKSIGTDRLNVAFSFFFFDIYTYLFFFFRTQTLNELCRG